MTPQTAGRAVKAGPCGAAALGAPDWRRRPTGGAVAAQAAPGVAAATQLKPVDAGWRPPAATAASAAMVVAAVMRSAPVPAVTVGMPCRWAGRRRGAAAAARGAPTMMTAALAAAGGDVTVADCGFGGQPAPPLRIGGNGGIGRGRRGGNRGAGGAGGVRDVTGNVGRLGSPRRPGRRGYGGDGGDGGDGDLTVRAAPGAVSGAGAPGQAPAHVMGSVRLRAPRCRGRWRQPGVTAVMIGDGGGGAGTRPAGAAGSGRTARGGRCPAVEGGAGAAAALVMRDRREHHRYDADRIAAKKCAPAVTMNSIRRGVQRSQKNTKSTPTARSAAASAMTCRPARA